MRSKQCVNLSKLNIILLSKPEVDDIDNNRYQHWHMDIAFLHMIYKMKAGHNNSYY